MPTPARADVPAAAPPASDPAAPISGVPRGLAASRIPGSIDEARVMVAYNERIIGESGSRQRRTRAAAMLVNLRPHLARLEDEEVSRLARIDRASPPAGTFDGVLQRFRDAAAEAREFEVVDNGTMRRAGGGIVRSSDLTGSSLSPGPGYLVRTE